MFGACAEDGPIFQAWPCPPAGNRCSGSAFRGTRFFKGGPSPHRERDFAGGKGTFSRGRAFRFSGDAHVRAPWERSFSGRNFVFSSGSNRIFWEKSSLFFRLKPSFRGKIPFPAKLKPIFPWRKFLFVQAPAAEVPVCPAGAFASVRDKAFSMLFLASTGNPARMPEKRNHLLLAGSKTVPVSI